MLTTVELFKLAQEEIMPFLFSFYDEDTRVSTSHSYNRKPQGAVSSFDRVYLCRVA